MKKSTTALTLALALASSNAAALPFIDFWVGTYLWNTTTNGSLSTDPIDLSLHNDLNLNNSSNNVTWGAFEHPIPLIPNIQIKNTQLKTTGVGSVDESFIFGGETYSSNFDLSSSIDLSHTDFTTYWSLPIPILTVDFGINIRTFDGGLAISTSRGKGEAIIDVPISMVFARVGAYVPFTGVSVMAETNYIGFGNTNHFDYQVVARYTLPIAPVVDVNVEAGYRSFQLDIDSSDFKSSENDLTADIDMSGFFIGVSLHL